MFKIKVLLPVERVGQLVMQCDPNMSFYQFIKPLLIEHNINPAKYILIDEYNRQFSMSKPMNQSGFYRGIAVEFKECTEKEKLEDLEINPILTDTVEITFTFSFDNLPAKKIKVFRYMSPQAALLQQKVFKELPENMICIYDTDPYPVHFSFDEMGVYEDCEIQCVIQENQPALKIPVSEDFVTKDETKMTKEDYLRFKQEQKRWESEMGIGVFNTAEEKEVMKVARIERKGIIIFKVLSTQMMKNICKFQINANGNLNDVYIAFNEVLKEKFKEEFKENAEGMDTLLKGYVLKQGRGGQGIDKNELSAYDHFDGGNALLDLQVPEEFVNLKW